MGKKSERREQRTAAAKAREAAARTREAEEAARYAAEDMARWRAEREERRRLASEPTVPKALGLEGPDRAAEPMALLEADPSAYQGFDVAAQGERRRLAEAPLLSIEPRPRVASIHPEPVRLAPPRARRSGMSRALLAMALLGLGGLPRDPGEG